MEIKEGFLNLDNFYDSNKDFLGSLGFGWFTFLMKSGYIVRSCRMVPVDNSFVVNRGNFQSNRRGNVMVDRSSRPSLKKVCSFYPNADKLRVGIDYLDDGGNYYYNNNFLLDVLKDEYKRRRL